jgi:hypothetical protein
LSRLCHGRFHDILPKEYSETFPELLWGKMIYYKMRCLLAIRVRQTLSLTRLIPEIKVECVWHFYPSLIFIIVVNKAYLH